MFLLFFLDKNSHFSDVVFTLIGNRLFTVYSSNFLMNSNVYPMLLLIDVVCNDDDDTCVNFFLFVEFVWFPVQSGTYKLAALFSVARCCLLLFKHVETASRYLISSAKLAAVDVKIGPISGISELVLFCLFLFLLA